MTASEKFRVGIDGFNLALPRGTGVATYARTLSFALRQMHHPVDVLFGMHISRRMAPDLREVVFFNSFGQADTRKKRVPLTLPWWRDQVTYLRGNDAVEVPMTDRVEQRQFSDRMPAYDRILNCPAVFQRASRYFRRTGRCLTVTVPNSPKIMHWTYPLPIRVRNSINIYTIHDLVPLRFPNTTLDDKGYYFRLIKMLTETSDGIATVSEASKKEILSFFPHVENKTYNTYQSFVRDKESDSRPLAETIKEVRGVFGLEPHSYFIFFGSLEPKKNIGRIIEAFLSADTNRQMVLVGAMAWKNEHELRFLQRGIECNRIISIEYLPKLALHSLIRNARAVVFPSLAEGFGLPILEAMSFGVPVMTSKETAIPEVAGKAALYVDAYDVSSITQGFERLDRDDELCQSLQEMGTKQAQNFDMKKFEDRLDSMYRQIIAANPTI